jgi:type I restriction enzyme S subunit
MKSQVNKIPKDWKIVKLEDVILDIGDGGTPSTKIKEYFNGTISWVNIEDIKRDIYDTRRHLSEAGLKNSSAKLWPEGTIIFSFGASIGKVGIARVKLCTKQGIAGIVPNSNKIDSEFLYYVLVKESEKIKKIGQSMGSTIREVRPSKLVKLIVFGLPPLSEQKTIAQVLSTLDKAIQKVDEIIAKTERLKKGLMKELLTGRIRVEEKDGKIVFRKETEFKDTEIGKIPKDWEVVKVVDKEIAEIRGNKRINNFDKVAFIPMELIPDSSIFVTYEIRALKNVKSYIYCEGGDILLAKITPSLENGKQGLVPDDIPNGFALATTEVFPIRCKGINRLFLFYILKFSKFRNKIIASMIGTTGRKRASKKSIENLKIPFPPFSEQEKIAEILLTIDKKLELERKRKENLERIKKGLMDLLLTGKIRITQFRNKSKQQIQETSFKYFNDK